MTKSKIQKKKDREKEVRRKILKKREAHRLEIKKNNENVKEQIKTQKIANKVDGRTYINRDPALQHDLIQKNIDILKALEDHQNELDQQKIIKKDKVSADVVFTPNIKS